MNLEPTSLGPNWWTSLSHGGLLIAPAMVDKFFGADIEPLSGWKAEILRRAVTRRAESGVRALLDTIFVQVLGYDANQWNRNPSSEQWSHRLITGETERPHRLFVPEVGNPFPVFTEKPEIRIGYHRGRKSVANVVEWLRKANLKIALLATEQQWRLIYAGSDFEAWCEWNLDLWFEGGQPALQVEALRRLLDPTAVSKTVVDAIQDSRRGQAELTSVLGERVRQAVEKLIQASAANLENLNVLPPDIYLAATRLIMRCVVALFAEGKGMLGRDMPAYHDSYGIQGLREQLERLSQGRRDALQDTQFAWPRLVALFRLIYTGSVHPQLTTMRYGGTLFEPGNPQSNDAVLRAVAAFETSYPCPRDRDVYEILLLLTRTYVKVSQGRGARNVPTPVDFSNLDTEYIGILYEGLLDYDLKRADEPVVFIRLGDEPALRVSDLEAIAPNKLKDVFGKLDKKATLSVSDEGGESDDAGEEVENEENEEEAGETAKPEDDLLSIDDFDDAAVRRAHAWAVAAVKAGGRVRAPRKRTEAAVKKYEEDVENEARSLFSRVVRSGDWYLVRFGNTRKGSGTFYTRKELASPTVRGTLAPLVRDEAGLPRKPEEILAVKVCDPAVGSGSFLISALRYMTEALFDSLHVHGRIYESAGNRCYDLGIIAPDCLPDGDDFEDRLRARLRRHVVERCLYGVDLNPLAIELARMSLWIETMDPRLPFGFLDHKLKPGNALVGCWFDRFEDYPVMAWMREGGDKDYEPVNTRANWTKAIASELRDRVKPNLVRMISSGTQQNLPLAQGKTPVEICQEVRERLNHIHSLSLTEPDQQRKEYENLRSDPGFQRLRQAFDLWCGLWFWPGDELKKAPISADFLAPADETLRIAGALSARHRFFHWELEFPDVFRRAGDGFNAIIGNPPWETQKPNSLEFFSNIDPLYRTYGKQEALQQQKAYFRNDGSHESSWITERGRIKALSNWVKYVAVPFGARVTYSAQGRPEFDCSLGSGFEASQGLHDRWQRLRSDRTTYSDRDHPFSVQGSADLNTYKMFLEVALKLGMDGARVGMLVPGGVYSDFGAKALRAYLLSRCQWTRLYAFQNERFVFENIDHRFKVTIVQGVKGGTTDSIWTRFRLGPAQSPTVAEIEDDIVHGSYLRNSATQINQFSPSSTALLEIRSEQERRLLEKVYSHGVLVGDQSENGWGLQYAREFDMTNDSDMFPPLSDWEAKGYRPDEYGHWLKGGWTEHSGPQSILHRERDVVLSADGRNSIRIADVEDIALPLYEGRMIGQFDFSEKGWVKGKGRTAEWEEIPWERKRIRPQYLTSFRAARGSNGIFLGPKAAFMPISASTNTRTTISSYLQGSPTGHSISLYLLREDRTDDVLTIVALLNSYVFDWQVRLRMIGLNLSAFILNESVFPLRDSIGPQIRRLCARLAIPASLFASQWRGNLVTSRRTAWKALWALTAQERVRIRSIIDSAIASAYGLSRDELRAILSGCDHPVHSLANNRFTRTLDPKGFWRVDRYEHPELRQTVLTMVAYQELERIGLDAFLNLNDGEGWMLPENLRLADYDLGCDDRAKEVQPVAPALGPRFYDWQLAQPAEESWEECAWHAELLEKLVPTAQTKPKDEPKAGDSPTNLFGEPIPTDLFGNPIYSQASKKKAR